MLQNKKDQQHSLIRMSIKNHWAILDSKKITIYYQINNLETNQQIKKAQILLI